MKHYFSIIFVISLISISSSPFLFIHQDEFTVSEIEAILGSTYELITEIEAHGADVSQINKDFNEILSLLSNVKYYHSINDEENINNLEPSLYEKTIQLENDSNELYLKSITDYGLYKRNLFYKTMVLDVISILSTIVAWNLILRFYYDKIKKHKMVVEK